MAEKEDPVVIGKLKKFISLTKQRCWGTEVQYGGYRAHVYPPRTAVYREWNLVMPAQYGSGQLAYGNSKLLLTKSSKSLLAHVLQKKHMCKSWDNSGCFVWPSSLCYTGFRSSLMHWLSFPNNLNLSHGSFKYYSQMVHKGSKNKSSCNVGQQVWCYMQS